MSEHTPKSWTAQLRDTGIKSPLYAWQVKGIPGGCLTHEEDARLIAAAPDLLAACQVALAAMEGNEPATIRSLVLACRDLKAAIRKAKGDA